MDRQAPQGEPLFIANIPRKIEAEWDPRFAYLAGFPLNLLYSSRSAAVCYWFEPQTYREDDKAREMWYLPRRLIGYGVLVRQEKATGRWAVSKYRCGQLVRLAFGSEFDGAMLHATLSGPESDEGTDQDDAESTPGSPAEL